MAIIYNDISVLENMHASITFSSMKQVNKKSDVLKTVSKENWVMMRKIIIEMILDTDMAKHFDSLGKFRAKCLQANNQFS